MNAADMRASALEYLPPDVDPQTVDELIEVIRYRACLTNGKGDILWQGDRLYRNPMDADREAAEHLKQHAA